MSGSRDRVPTESGGAGRNVAASISASSSAAMPVRSVGRCTRSGPGRRPSPVRSLLALLPLLLPVPASAQKGYPPDVLEKYWACMERNDLAAISQTLAQHQIRRIDATIYGLPKDDLDDRSLLTIEERLLIRREKKQAGNPLPETGPLQYPHHLRQALDNWYEVTGKKPDCSRILEAEGGGKRGREADSAGGPLPDTVQSGWASDRNLTTGDASDRGEVNIAIDPANPARLMASSCPAGGGETSNHIAYTSDWGQTWTSTQVGNNSGSTWECDPVS